MEIGDQVVQILVDQEACTRCGTCVALCTGRVFECVDGRVEATDPDACWLCGHCVAACPTDAIDHSTYALEDCPLLDSDVLSLEGLVASFRERRSLRVFRDEPVPREVVRELVDIARWAPKRWTRAWRALTVSNGWRSDTPRVRIPCSSAPRSCWWPTFPMTTTLVVTTRSTPPTT